MSMNLVLESFPAGTSAESQPTTLRRRRITAAAGGPLLSLEKAWHGLHYLLTGDPWGGDGPEAFLLAGGTPQGRDLGYGPARVFEPTEVSEIAAVLREISPETLWLRFDAGQLAEAEIYGTDWEEEHPDDLREEYLEYYEALQEFLGRTADSGHALRLTMT